MAAPSIEIISAYMGDNSSYDEDAMTSAYSAELTAQQAVCTIPTVTDDDDVATQVWTDDLVEALCRRVASNLANRNLPLGVQTQVGEFGGVQTRVGGLDREVRRLEGPYRKVLLG